MASRNAILRDALKAVKAVMARPEDDVWTGLALAENAIANMMTPPPRQSAHHKRLMESYYMAREAQQRRCEAATLGYLTEAAVYYRDIEPRLTFKAWLMNQKESAT